MLWKRRWIIVSVIAVALVTAAAYLQLRTETFTSSGTLRLNAVVTDAATAGSFGGVAVDIDSDIIGAPAVLEPAAEKLGVDVGTLAGSIAVKINAESRLARITVVGEGDSPDAAMRTATAVITSFQAYVDAQIAATMGQLQQAQSAATATAQDLQQKVAANPGDSISQANLQTALQRMTSTTAAIDMINTGGANTIVLRQPSEGTSTFPSLWVVLGLALLTGLIIGIAVALIRDQFDNRLRGEDEVEPLTGARSIGELSWDRTLRRTGDGLPVASNERTDLSERLRTLRSNLAVFLPARGAAFVVTSVEPGDGKSFVSANLALAWARAGKRVILVGGDLRRPDLARYFGDAADGEGLSDILQEHESGDELSTASVQSRLNSTRYRRLTVLPSGPEPSEPADLFAGPVLAELVARLRTLADVVVIDSPPALGMVDAALLANPTDGAIVLASIRKTDRVRLLEALEALRAAGTEVLGVVSNRSRRKLPKSYSSYYVGGSGSVPRVPMRSPLPGAEDSVAEPGPDSEDALLRRGRDRIGGGSEELTEAEALFADDPADDPAEADEENGIDDEAPDEREAPERSKGRGPSRS